MLSTIEYSKEENTTGPLLRPLIRKQSVVKIPIVCVLWSCEIPHLERKDVTETQTKIWNNLLTE